MNASTHVQVSLDDGDFYAPEAYVEALAEEREARGALTVAEAASLCEKWSRPVKL